MWLWTWMWVGLALADDDSPLVLWVEEGQSYQVQSSIILGAEPSVPGSSSRVDTRPSKSTGRTVERPVQLWVERDGQRLSMPVLFELLDDRPNQERFEANRKQRVRTALAGSAVSAVLVGAGVFALAATGPEPDPEQFESVDAWRAADRQRALWRGVGLGLTGLGTVGATVTIGVGIGGHNRARNATTWYGESVLDKRIDAFNADLPDY